VHVRVVWQDGSPVAGANVARRDVTYDEQAVGYGGRTDGDGRISFKAYEGQTLSVEASSNEVYRYDPRRSGPDERSKPVRVLVARPVESVTVVITRLR
jgi:hypothetical protein